MHVVDPNTLISGQLIGLMTRASIAHMHFDRNSQCLFITYNGSTRFTGNCSKTSLYVHKLCTYIWNWDRISVFLHPIHIGGRKHTPHTHARTQSEIVQHSATSTTDLWTIGGQQQNCALLASAISDAQTYNKIILDPTMLSLSLTLSPTVFVLRHVYVLGIIKLSDFDSMFLLCSVYETSGICCWRKL